MCIIRKPQTEGTEWQCEDLARVNDKYILTGCGDLEQRKVWYAPMGKELRNASAFEPRDAFFLLDIESKKFTKVQFKGTNAVLHGFKYKPINDQIGEVLAVNHLPTGSVIDLYLLDVKAMSMKLVKRISDLLITTPNNVEFFDNGFFTTNDHKFQHGILRQIEDYLQLPLGHVVYCKFEEPHKCSAFERLKYPNGIVIWNNKLYVAASTDASLYTYVISTRGSFISLRPSTIIPLDFMPDNLNVVDNRLIVGGFPKVLSFLATAKPDNFLYSTLKRMGIVSQHAWSKVVEMKLHDEEWYMGERLKSIPLMVDDGSVVNGSTGGLIINSKLYISMLFGGESDIARQNVRSPNNDTLNVIPVDTPSTDGNPKFLSEGKSVRLKRRQLADNEITHIVRLYRRQDEEEEEGGEEGGGTSGEAATDGDDQFVNGDGTIGKDLDEFCANSGQETADGTQKDDGVCSQMIQGQIPDVTRQVSSLIVEPKDGEKLKSNEPIQITVRVKNLETGFFDDPDEAYYAQPQTLNDDGIIQGHSHVVVERIDNIEDPPDPQDFDFFQGLDQTADDNDDLSAVIENGLEPGDYRICSMAGSIGHQPVIMPKAKRGAQDDCIRISVADDGKSQDIDNDDDDGDGEGGNNDDDNEDEGEDQ